MKPAPESTIHCTSNTGRLREALVKHPRDAFRSPEDLASDWKRLGFTGLPDFDKACDQFDAFAEILQSEGVSVHRLPENKATDADSLYTHDPVTAAAGGLVVGSMGKQSRQPETTAVRDWAHATGRPVLGTIHGTGLLEGGDLIWLDDTTVAIGIGFRSNTEGARQFAALTGATVIEVPLPFWNGPSDILHLMSLISPLAPDLALVYRRLLPVTFVTELDRRGIRMLDVPDDEYPSMGCNVLALSPRVCLAVAGNPATRRVMEAAGCRVLAYEGSEISLKGQGGPTCLTRPLLRDATN